MNTISRSFLTVRADTEGMRAVRALATAFANDCRIGEADRARILIILEELITNVIKYGSAPGGLPGSIELSLSLEGDRLTVRIVDDTPEFDPFSQAEPDLDAPVEARSIGRLGLPIVKALTDNRRYRREDGRNVVELERRVALSP